MPNYAVQSPSILVYDNQIDFGLNNTQFSDRSAAGVGANGEFMLFLASSINTNLSNKSPNYDALTLRQFAEIGDETIEALFGKEFLACMLSVEEKNGNVDVYTEYK
jgi:hypothetical protein